MTDFSPDSFTSNPFVQSIGQMIAPGLFIEGGPPAAGAAGPSPASVKAAAPPTPRIAADKPPVTEQRVAQLRESATVRQRYPQAKGMTRGSTPGGGGSNVGMNMPGVMSSDVLMHPAVQQLLGQYGISPDSIQHTVDTASPNMFITNPAAYEKHPVLAGMIERGLEGAAFTKGSSTWGEGISNVAQGMLNANAARADKYNNQLMMPFEQAKQVADLQNVSVEQNLKRAQTQYDQQHAAYWDQLPDILKQREADKKDFNDQMVDMKGHLGLMSYLNAHKDFALNPDEQKQVSDLVAQHNGNEQEVPFTDLQGIYNGAIKRYEDKKAADQLARANVVGGWGVKKSKVTADHEADKLSNADAKTALDTINKQYESFKRQNASTRDGRDLSGKYVRGKAATDKAAQEHVQKINDLQTQLNQIPESMKTPGAGMTQTPPGAHYLWTGSGVVPKPKTN